MKNTVSCALLMFAVCLAGCGEDLHGVEGQRVFVDSQPDSDWLQVTGSIVLTDPPGYSGPEASQETQMEWVDEAMGLIDHALGTTDDWRTAESSIARLLDSPVAESNPMVARIAPVALLRSHLFRADDAEALPAIRRYTERLIQDRSEETETIAEGLERIREVTPSADLTRLAIRATEVGEAWMLTCSECSTPLPVDEGLKQPQVEPDRTVSLDRLADIARSER